MYPYLHLLICGCVRRKRRGRVDFQQPRFKSFVEKDVVAVEPEAMLVVNHHLKSGRVKAYGNGLLRGDR